MTAWSPPMVAQFAYEAGWRSDSLVEAVGVAWLSSAGRDDVEAPRAHPDVPSRVGMWLVPEVDEVAQLGNLFDPRNNARAGYLLWARAGGSWTWTPVWAANVGRMPLDMARSAVQSRGAPQQSPLFPIGPDGDRLRRMVRDQTNVDRGRMRPNG